MTPLDIAGSHASHEAAIVFLYFFKINFDVIIDMFSEDRYFRKYDKLFNPHKLESLKFPYTLYRLSKNSFSITEMCFAKVFYWAGYYGEKELCQYFMKYLGMSPFIKLFMEQDVIGACVKGG